MGRMLANLVRCLCCLCCVRARDTWTGIGKSTLLKVRMKTLQYQRLILL
jgi:hypothetical protein